MPTLWPGEMSLFIRFEDGGPDVLAEIAVLLGVRARTPGIDAVTLSGKLHSVQLASPDGHVHEPSNALAHRALP